MWLEQPLSSIQGASLFSALRAVCTIRDSFSSFGCPFSFHIFLTPILDSCIVSSYLVCCTYLYGIFLLYLMPYD